VPSEEGRHFNRLHTGLKHFFARPGLRTAFTEDFSPRLRHDPCISQPQPPPACLSAMHTKRLLFIQDDPLLGSLYREKLEGVGFAVETARDGKAGLHLLHQMRPDLMVVDPVLPSMDAVESIRAIRAQEAGRSIPIVVLPTIHHALGQSALHAGATRLLEPATNPFPMLLEAVSSATGMHFAGPSVGEASGLEEHWKQATLSAAPGTLAALRQSLHTVMRDPQLPDALRDLLQRTHCFAGQMSLLGQNAITHVTSALEILVYGLQQVPERVDALVLRTLGQAVDFLAQLLDRGAHAQEPNLEAAHIMVIEDEESARELIITAMSLVGLRADGLDAPAAGLAVLSTQRSDLIFLDVNLPEMNGFELCTKVRALPLHEKTPIVFLTGMTSFQNRVQSSLSGGNDFVGKPFNMAELGVKALIWVLKGQLGLP
jgi:DNA-binding response OmpR family regulator